MNLLSSTLFRILVLSIISLSLIGVYVIGTPTQWNPGGWGEVLLNGMGLYLIGLFLRTVFYLGFSFMDFIKRTQMGEPIKYPLVTIIIPCYNEEVVIQTAILSATKVHYPNLEILVIDDGSTDNTLQKSLEISQNHKNVRVVNKPNGGKADALNWGLREAYGEYVLCVDADSILDSKALMYSVPYLENDPTIAAVAGSVLIGNSKSNMLTRFQHLEYIIGLNFYKTAQSYLGIVTIVPGPIGLFRRKTVIDAGAYTTDTFAEDCDLTIRLLMNGYQIKYRPEMKAYTEAPESIQALFTQRYRWSRGVIQAIVKNAHHLKSKKTNFRNQIILLQMIGDSIVIPLTNYVFSMGTIIYALQSQEFIQGFFGPFFLGLVTLDVLLTLFSSFDNSNILSLSGLTFLNRMTYGLAMEIVRFFAMLDELIGVPMKWGFLKRKGLS